MGKKIDLTGERFGRLNVLSEVPERDGNTLDQFKEYVSNKTFITN